MPLDTFNPPRAPTTGTSDKPKVKWLRADFGDGYTQIAPDGINNVKRILSLTWEGLQAAKADQITDFLMAKARKAEPFYYTPSGETTPVKWTCESWETKKDGLVKTVVATFEQSFSLLS